MSGKREESNSAKSGTVKWFDSAKGWGFINPDDDPDLDVFVHYSAVPGESGRKNLIVGDKVTYIEGTRDGRVYAVKVVVVVRS